MSMTFSEKYRALLCKKRQWQEGCGMIPGFWIWTLDEDMPGHPKNSTVAESTILAAGFRPVEVVSDNPTAKDLADFDRRENVGCNL